MAKSLSEPCTLRIMASATRSPNLWKRITKLEQACLARQMATAFACKWLRRQVFMVSEGGGQTKRRPLENGAEGQEAGIEGQTGLFGRPPCRSDLQRGPSDSGPAE